MEPPTDLFPYGKPLGMPQISEMAWCERRLPEKPSASGVQHRGFTLRHKCAIHGQIFLTAQSAHTMSGGNMFDTLKKVCTFNSEELASKYLLMKGRNPECLDLSGTHYLRRHASAIEDICKQMNIQASFGTVRSRFKHPEEEWIDVSVFVQTFAHDAPALKEFINDIARSFDIQQTEEGPRIVDLEKNQADYQSEYFVSGNHFFGVDLATGEVMTIEGKHVGGTLRESEGKASISGNLEIEQSMADLTHEIVQIKFQGQIDRSDTFEDLFPEIQGRIKKRLKMSISNPFREIEEIAKERSQVIDKFIIFDDKLRRLLRCL
jgi:hypothetical protein